MPSQIFLTGAGGFIGRALGRLADPTLRVVAIPRDAAPERLVAQRGGGSAALVHLAWPDLRASSSGGGGGAAPEVWSRFVEWSLALRQACAEADIDFIGVGSGVEAYVGDPALADPYLAYARRKADLRAALESLGEIAWVRLHFIFGPGEHPGRIVPAAIRAALSGEEFACGSPDRRRCWLDVDALAQALAGFAAVPRPGTWDICGREPISFAELLALVERAVGRPLKLAKAPAETADGRLKLIAPTRLAPNLPSEAGRPANLLASLLRYSEWIAAGSRGENGDEQRI